MSELISVIVPVHNAAGHLNKCLQSILAQTYPHLEVIVVDDGSTDASPAVIQSFASTDGRFRPITQPNSGVSAARNAGIELATGNYLSFIDADDWLEPDAYSAVIEEFARQRVDFVAFDYSVDSSESSRVRRVPDRYYGTHDCRTGLESVLKTHNRFVVSRVWKRELVGATRFREDLHWGEDTVFVVETAKRADASAFLPRAFYHYVQSDDSATRSRFNPKRLSGLKMTEVLEDLIRDDHPDLVDAVLATRVNIVGVLAHDALESSDIASTDIVRGLGRFLRGDWHRIIASREISRKAKLKASLITVSPPAFARLHRARLWPERGRQ